MWMNFDGGKCAFQCQGMTDSFVLCVSDEILKLITF